MVKRSLLDDRRTKFKQSNPSINQARKKKKKNKERKKEKKDERIAKRPNNKSNRRETNGKGFGETVGDVTRLSNGRRGGKQINVRAIRAKRSRSFHRNIDVKDERVFSNSSPCIRTETCSPIDR